MTHGPIKIESKGVCIYCNRSGIKLTDEHIVPLSLGGVHVISKASCDDCAKITTRFEREVARGMWGDARISYDAPSRRKKARNKYIFLEDRFKPGNKLKIPYNEYPSPMVFYVMDAAGILLGKPENINLSNSWTFIAIHDDKKVKDFEAKYPGNLTAKFCNSPDSFSRLIAKIGYGQIMYSLDIGDFRPICLPYILGEKSNVSFVVGGRKSIPDPKLGIGYELNSHCFGTSARIIILAEVRLIANNCTPTYHVVVGDVVGSERVLIVMKKLKATYTAIIPDTTKGELHPEDEYHWMPRVWPLPFWQ